MLWITFDFCAVNAWEKRKLKDLVVRITKLSDDSALPSIEYEDIISGEGRLNKDYRVKIGAKKGILFRPKDILFGKLRPYLHNWLFPNFRGKAVGDFWVLRTNGCLLPGYLFSLIQAPRFQDVANISSGTKMPRSDWKTVANTSFFIPDIPEQQCLWQSVDRLDNLIAATQQKIDILTEIRSVLQQRFFDQYMRFKNYSGLWERKKLGQLVTAYSGGTPRANESKYYNGDIPFIRSAEIHQDRTALSITKEGLHHSSAKLVKRGDILYALYGANSGDVSRAKINGAINQAILAMLPKKNVNSDFLVYQLMNQEKYIVGTYLQGGQGNLSGKIVLDLTICIPSMVSEQEKIGTTLREFTNLISLMTNRRSKLEAVKKYLLQNLFN